MNKAIWILELGAVKGAIICVGARGESCIVSFLCGSAVQQLQALDAASFRHGPRQCH